VKPNPNVVMILVDEMRADALSCFGNQVARTANIDRLAETGVRFSQCMIPQPTCTPCRARLLAGFFPSAVRSRMVGCTTPDDARFLPRVLRQAGYRTASIGKIHLVPQRWEPDALAATRQPDGTHDYYGFEHVDLVNGHGDGCFGPLYTPWLRERVSDVEQRRRARESLCKVPACYRWPLPPEVHSSQYIADRSVEYLKGVAERDEPFFLCCSFPDPHHPFTVPEPYASIFDPSDMPAPRPPLTESLDPPLIGLEAYRGDDTPLHRADGSRTDRLIGTPPHDYREFGEHDWRVVRAITTGMVAQLDACIGRVLDALDQSNLAQNTIVVFASDHGDYLGDYGMYGKGLHYDCVLRTPLIMRGPGLPRGVTIDRMASLVDVAPTLLDLVGVDPPEAQTGLSLKAGLDNPAAWPRDAALTENDDDMACVRMRTLTTRDWKLTIYAGQAFGELYDRQRDPHERRNLWSDPDHAAVRAAMTAALADHMLCAIDGSNGRTQPTACPVVRHSPRPIFEDQRHTESKRPVPANGERINDGKGHGV
jgi:arylsulfatase A-like enzyme